MGLQALSNHRFTIYPFSNCPNYLKVNPANAWEPGNPALSRQFKDITSESWEMLWSELAARSSEVRRRLLAETREDLDTNSAHRDQAGTRGPPGVRNRKSMQRIEHLYPAQAGQDPARGPEMT